MALHLAASYTSESKSLKLKQAASFQFLKGTFELDISYLLGVFRFFLSGLAGTEAGQQWLEKVGEGLVSRLLVQHLVMKPHQCLHLQLA